MTLARSCALLSSALFIAYLPHAWSQDAGRGPYVRGAMGVAAVDQEMISDRTAALQLAGGYRWQVFSLEAGLLNAHGFQETEDLRVIDGPRAEFDYDVRGWTLGAAARWQVSRRNHVTARAGLLHWDTDLRVNLCFDTCTARTLGFQGTDAYFGVGWAYDWRERLSVGLSYDRFRAGLYRGYFPGDDGPAFDIHTDIDVLSTTVEWRF